MDLSTNGELRKLGGCTPKSGETTIKRHEVIGKRRREKK